MLSAVVVIYKIFEIRNKEDFKIFEKIFLTRILGVLIPIFFFAIYLTHNNIWVEFIDYAIQGIGTFSNSVSITKLIEDEVFIAYVIPFFFAINFIITLTTYIIKRLKEKGWVNSLHILFYYNLASIVVIYPIADLMHFSIATIFTYISTMYLLYIWFEYVLKIDTLKSIVKVRIILKILAVIFIAVFSIISIKELIGFTRNIDNKKYLNHFKFIEVEENLYNRILNLDEYIIKKENENNKVIVVDTMAAAINIPINVYNKDFDMFNLGNLGRDGTKRNY